MRALNLQTLTDATKRRHPGVVVYGIGDTAHMLRTSDHNEDDTAGSRAAQSDADSNPEHRAIDVMLGAPFTKAQAYAYIADLLADPAARVRLRYIIFDGWIWHRDNGWAKREFTGDDKHRDHIHVSGQASADENAAAWPTVDGGDMALTEDDIERIARRVANWDYQNGPGEAPAYVVANRASAAAGAAAEGVKVLDGKLTAVAGKVDELASPDLDALADKVADRLAAKLNLGFVPASPPAQG